MPYKDEDLRREKNAERMRKRRQEALKSEKFGESTSEAAPSIESPLAEIPQEVRPPGETITEIASVSENLCQGALFSLAPPTIDIEKAHLVDFADQVSQVVNRWYEFPNEKGFQCCKAPGDCCFPLVSQVLELRVAPKECAWQSEICPYYKEKGGRNG